MLSAGDLRRRIAVTLNAAYGDGLLSENTFAHRLDLLFGSSLVDPGSLVGDLTLRPRRRGRRLGSDLLRTLAGAGEALGLSGPADGSPPVLLALDWAGGQSDLVVGRHYECDVVLSDPSVSRRHARLRFRDGNWILRDLDSTNGSQVNGAPVVRCQLRPGDRLRLGDELLLVD
jgi:FHA domain-containing protein